jgi:AP-3 complex subunit delta-1
MSWQVNRSNVRDIVSQLLSHLVPPTTTAATLPSAMASLQGKAIDEPSAGITSPPSSAIMSPAYRLEVVRRILQITSADTYSNITDFDWYMSVLIDLTYVSNVDVGEQIKDIILDVVARVRSVRSNAVGLLARLLDDTSFLDNLGEECYCGEVIYAAAWVCGEYNR